MDSPRRSATTPTCMRPSVWAAGPTPRLLIRSVCSGLEAAAELVVPGLAGCVQPDDLDVLAALRVLELDGVERGDRGGVEDLGLAEVDDDVLRVTGIVELVDEIVAGGEEQRALDRIDPGVRVGMVDVDDLGEVGDPTGEEQRGDHDTEDNTVGEV